jgi:hypothetical protein
MVPQIKTGGPVKQAPALIRFDPCHSNAFGLTRATETPGPAATSAAATAATAPAASEAAAAAAAAAATTSAAPSSDFLAELRFCGIFLVEHIERRQAHVRDFLVTEKYFMIWGGVLRRNIRCRSAG